LTYDTWSGFEIPLVLGFVPQLSKLNLINKYTLDKTLVLRDLLANVPSINELHLDFRSEQVNAIISVSFFSFTWGAIFAKFVLIVNLFYLS
jgi:hypothetical protein